MARPSSKDIKNSKLYVTNLPDHFNQDQVVEVFEQVRGWLAAGFCPYVCTRMCFYFLVLGFSCLV